ncbi:LacI family DNA-binding transcriptional regulator [Nakamurella flavida]|uniref:LacI family DNA-binding transcriptional regulator n=1 Tax=Nakamurella flavida TaxID=363630 RepID=A0A939C1V8_9ACTN|nr:LacI family DNA-binding transcriptional regulator [Nakamurella flavida]MBM9475411.1 LacI family DNA-binding transcriptional regulator [Nakamurella flavida]MBM9475501.1 LacI family DNA-binding transcriptional regulator [Nakamurella flavida]MDP9776991.1 LacI family transcriptional regulator [Nakamurella flavida]
MNDVAREAGVALKTVSRFVNGERNIDPVLAGRIGAAIGTLGYRRNLAAASLRPGRSSRTIGLIISDLANPYYSTIARAIELLAREHGFLLTTASSDEEGDRHDALVDRLLGQQVEGLIVVPPRQAGRAWSQVPGPVPPVVFLDRPGDLAGADTILADNAGGARAATVELLAQGARSVAFVGDSRAISTMAERYRGYADALAEHGLAPDPALVSAAAHSKDQAAAVVAELMASGAADAVFAANNRASLGAVLAFRESGRRLPLIGFDDFEAAALLTPAVSVVSQDVTEMGRLAAELVLDRLSGAPARSDRLQILPTRLILRGSERVGHAAGGDR